MNTFFEFEENLSFEDELVPGLSDFYRDYAIAIISQADIKYAASKASFKCLVNDLQELADQGNRDAKTLLKDIYRDNLASRVAA